MSFDIAAVEAQHKKVAEDEAWFEMEGRAFGRHGNYPLRVLIATEPKKWRDGWNDGLDRYSKGLSPSQRKDFQRQCQIGLTIPDEAQARAARAGIRHSGCLKKVAYAGPKFDSYDELNKWAESNAINCDIVNAFRPGEDGKIALPMTTDPPNEWIATDAQVSEILRHDDFCMQIMILRRELEDGGSEAEEESAKNLLPGHTTKPVGMLSPRPNESH